MEAWSAWQEVEKIQVFCVFFLEKQPLTGNFSKFCSKRIHRHTDRRVVFKFREIWRQEIGKNCALLTWQKNKKIAWLSSSRYCAVAPKIRQGQSQIMYSQCSRFHPNPFNFGRVISERVNTARSRSKLNPIFGWSLPSNRIKTKSKNRHSRWWR